MTFCRKHFTFEQPRWISQGQSRMVRWRHYIWLVMFVHYIWLVMFDAGEKSQLGTSCFNWTGLDGYIGFSVFTWRRNVLMMYSTSCTGDGFDQFFHQYPLSFYIDVGNHHSKDFTNIEILSPTSKFCRQHLKLLTLTLSNRHLQLQLIGADLNNWDSLQLDWSGWSWLGLFWTYPKI